MKYFDLRVIFKIIGCLCILAFILTFGIGSHISASEFWPISLSKEVFFHGKTIDSGLFLKPTFHLILGLIYFLPLDNWQHVLVARILFALIGASSLSIFIYWLKNLLFKSSESFGNLGWAIAFLLSPIFVEQLVKIRSDMLSLFFSLLVLVLACSSPPPHSRSKFLSLILLNLALFGCTPRAIFHEMVVLSFLIPFYGSIFRLHREALNQYLIIFGMPLIFSLVIFLKVGLGSPLYNIYLSQSFASGFWEFGFVKSWLYREPAGSSCILIGLIFLIYKMILKKSSRIEVSLFLAALTAGLSIAFADLKTPFLIGSFYLFLMAPFIVIFFDFKFYSAKTSIALPLLFFVWVVIMQPIQRSFLFETNTYQKDIIQKLTSFMENHPDYRYFDGLGLLPRSRQILSYLGPSDALSLESAMQKLQTEKPEVILYTSRSMLLKPEFDQLLDSQYEMRDRNLYLKKSLPEQEGKIDFISAPILHFNL